MHDICTEFKLLLKSWNWLGYNLIWMKSNLYYSPSFKSSVILGCLFAALGIDLVSLLKSKYLILIPTICWTYFWDSCLWTGPLWRPIWFVLSLHRKAGKQENESSKDEKRETGKRGTQEGSESSVSSESTSIYPVLPHGQNWTCVCVCVWPWMCHSDSQSVFQEPPTVPAATTELRRLLTADFTLYGHPQLPPVSLPDPFPSFLSIGWSTVLAPNRFFDRRVEEKGQCEGNFLVNVSSPLWSLGDCL